jgi:hypothetical protein
MGIGSRGASLRMGHLNSSQVVKTKQAYFLKEENNGGSCLSVPWPIQSVAHCLLKTELNGTRTRRDHTNSPGHSEVKVT